MTKPFGSNDVICIDFGSHNVKVGSTAFDAP